MRAPKAVRVGRGVLALIAGLLLGLLPRAAAAQPILERPPGDWIVLTRLPPLLGREEIRKHLETGLTTTLAFQLRAGGESGGARVDIRYELWDEVWIVTRADASGRVQRATFPSFERLAEWWRDLRLEALKAGRSAMGRADGVAEVRLRVIPFSQSEQLDAQRWFSQALEQQARGGSGSGAAVTQALKEQPEPFGSVLNLLLATSIGRRALQEYEWNLRLPPAAGAKPETRK